MKNTLKIAIFLFFILSFACFNAFAVDFQIDQAKVRMRLPAGWSDGGVINVHNKDKEPVKIRVYVEDWVYSAADGSKNFMPAGTHANSCAEWIKFYPADFTVPPNGTQKLSYVVAVPPDATGGHYAVLFFEVALGETAGQTKGTVVKVFNRLGSLFYVEADGTIKREAEVSDFKIKSSQGSVEAGAVFQNTGNVDINSKGTFDIINEEGFVLARGDFNEVFTMPQDKARLYAKSTTTGNLTEGKYDAILTFDLGEATLVKEYSIGVSGSGNITSVQENKEQK